MKILNQLIENDHAIYNGDCVTTTQGIPDNSVGYTLFSIPFLNLYCYSDSPVDMGNCRTEKEFYEHFKFLIPELLRVTETGRNVSIHCMQVPAMKERDGYIGIKDFRGDIIRLMQGEGFIFHSEVLIWKDPLIEAVRTKAIGLMHKQLVKDSAMARQGLPDYLLTFRKPGENKKPIAHTYLEKMKAFVDNEGNVLDSSFYDALIDGIDGSWSEIEVEMKGLNCEYAGSMPLPSGVRSHNIFRRYASPVWWDIRQTLTLNYKEARGVRDEKHICPLQLDTIERALTLWSRKGDIVLSPYAGVGSEGYKALEMGRKFVGIELKPEYFGQMQKNLAKVGTGKQMSLYDE